MSLGFTSVDNESVGQSGGDFFKPDKTKQRVALVPSFLPSSLLEITDEMKKKASEGDSMMVDKIIEIEELKAGIEVGLKADHPRVQKLEKFTYDGKEQSGYLFGRVDFKKVHYFEATKRPMVCKEAEYKKAGREPLCCKEAAKEKRGGAAQVSYGVVLIVYETDTQGEVLKLPPERSKPLDENNRMDFKYKIQIATFSDARMKAWKEHSTDFPLISTDYKVWTEPQGKSERTKFSPCAGEALWLKKGPALLKQVLTEGADWWSKIGAMIGQDYSLDDLDVIFGITKKGSGGGGGTESSFGSLLS